MKLVFILFFFCTFSNVNTQTILNCNEIKSTYIGWENGGIFSKSSLVAKAINKPDKPLPLTLVLGKESAILKGNAGQVELTRISKDAFLEVTGIGNTFIWTVLSDEKGQPNKYVVQQKAYSISGPFTITIFYKCD